MWLLSFEGGFGRVEGDRVVPMAADARAYLSGSQPASDGAPFPLASARLRAPVPNPSKVVCVGLNYHDHAKETGKPVPVEPLLFGKFANSVVGHGARVQIPPSTEKVDYEGELAVVIGRTARRVPVQAARGHIAGYTVVNDLSARDLQWRLGQWTRGKAIDGFLPMGPWLVTADEIDDPHDLEVRTRVNGELAQHSSTARMIFSVDELVASISETITLVPGDVIATGTPPGIGAAADPPRFLAAGDEVEVAIARLGRLVTHLTAPTAAPDPE